MRVNEVNAKNQTETNGIQQKNIENHEKQKN
jgi:hypothetical protein